MDYFVIDYTDSTQLLSGIAGWTGFLTTSCFKNIQQSLWRQRKRAAQWSLHFPWRGSWDMCLRRKWGSTLRWVHWRKLFIRMFCWGCPASLQEWRRGGRCATECDTEAADDSWVSTETGRVWAWVSQFDLKSESAAGCDPVERMTKAEMVSFCWIERESAKTFKKCVFHHFSFASYTNVKSV